jgi:hypothetical protein
VYRPGAGEAHASVNIFDCALEQLHPAVCCNCLKIFPTKIIILALFQKKKKLAEVLQFGNSTR